jgi:hypothetical protein
MDISIGEIVLWAVVIWILSQIFLGFVDAMQITKLKERVEILKHLRSIIHQVKIEKDNGVEYWYDQDEGTFLGQGTTKEEVINTLKSRFPEHIFLIEDVGGVAAQTEWKLMSADEFKKLPLNLDNTK